MTTARSQLEVRRAWAHGLGVCMLISLSIWGSPAAAQSYDDIRQLMSQWQIQEAEGKLREMDGGSVGKQFLRARLDFLNGRYQRSLTRLDQLFQNVDPRGEWRKFRDLVETTAQTTQNYKKYTSENGRFEIYLPPGKDRVLKPYAFDALARAYETIGEELGYRPEPPIRVEVYPRTSTLAKVSGLTDDEIRTSGTIALCKYNRLMITSPKALLRGYSWVDTLIHEYVHYVINHKTSTRVPIWMHEGLAKFLERRWRGPEAHRLSPSSEYLLIERLESNDLVSFDQMHPSMAKLPSRKDAATAFAEVYTVMEYLKREAGEGAFKQLLNEVSKTDDARKAFARVLGTDFSSFRRNWKAYLRDRETRDFPEEYGYENQLVFEDEKSKKKTPEDRLEKSRALDHVKLGEMLQAKQRYGAAVVQYRKALKLSSMPSPRLRTQLARSLTETGEPGQALEVLRPVEQLYPSKASVWLRAGAAHLADGNLEAAVDDLREAARINPFHVKVHELLAEARTKQGSPDLAEKHRNFARMVD